MQIKRKYENRQKREGETEPKSRQVSKIIESALSIYIYTNYKILTGNETKTIERTERGAQEPRS